MTTEHQALQQQQEVERQAQAAEQLQEQEHLLQQQYQQFQEQEKAFFQLQHAFHQDPTPLREHELLMLQQAGQHAQEMFEQQRQYLLQRHQQEQLRLQERQWHQKQLLLQQIQQHQHEQHVQIQHQQHHHHQQQQQRPPYSPYPSTPTTPQAGQNKDTNHYFASQPLQGQREQFLDDTTEAMDVDDEVQLLSITSTIANLRQHHIATDTTSVSAWASGPASSRPSDDNDPDAIVVFDTNVLISHLNFLQSLIQKYGKGSSKSSTTTTGTQDPNIIFIIPWVVVQELDGLKGGGHGGGDEIDLTGKARRAIRYLQDELEKPEESRRIRGQKISEHIEKQQQNDDYILDCCRYFRNLYPDQSKTKVTLFSNDRNLCVKALIHEIKTISRDKIAFELEAVSTAIFGANQPNAMEEDFTMQDFGEDIGVEYTQSTRSQTSSSRSSRGNYRTEVNDRELQRIKATSKIVVAPDGMDSKLFELTNHIVKNLRRYLECLVPDHLKAYHGEDWRNITHFNGSRVKEEDLAYDCRRLMQPMVLLQRYWRNVFSDLYGTPNQAELVRPRLDSVLTFIKSWDRVQTFGLGKVYKKDLKVFLADVEYILMGLTKRPTQQKPSSSPSSSTAMLGTTPPQVGKFNKDHYYDDTSRKRLIISWKDHCKALHD